MSESDGKYPCAYIADGFSEDGYVAGVEHLHPPCSFTYRPMTSPERAQVLKAANVDRYDNAAKAEAAAAQAIAKKIVSWDLSDESGKTLPVTPHSLLRIRPALNSKIFNIVAGFQPSDEKPGEEGSDEDELDALLTGDQKEEVAEKN